MSAHFLPVAFIRILYTIFARACASRRLRHDCPTLNSLLSALISVFLDLSETLAVLEPIPAWPDASPRSHLAVAFAAPVALDSIASPVHILLGQTNPLPSARCPCPPKLRARGCAHAANRSTCAGASAYPETAPAVGNALSAQAIVLLTLHRRVPRAAVHDCSAPPPAARARGSYATAPLCSPPRRVQGPSYHAHRSRERCKACAVRAEHTYVRPFRRDRRQALRAANTRAQNRTRRWSRLGGMSRLARSRPAFSPCDGICVGRIGNRRLLMGIAMAPSVGRSCAFVCMLGGGQCGGGRKRVSCVQCVLYIPVRGCSGGGSPIVRLSLYIPMLHPRARRADNGRSRTWSPARACPVPWHRGPPLLLVPQRFSGVKVRQGGTSSEVPIPGLRCGTMCLKIPVAAAVP